MIHIYKIENKANGKFYIGSTVNIDKRKRQHLYLLRSGKHANAKLQSGFDFYGEDCFIFYSIDTTTKELRNTVEQYYINTPRPIYNIIKNVGEVHYPTSSREAAAKISKANTGKKRSLEAIAKVADWHRGKKRLKEVGEKISAAKKGKSGTKGINAKTVVRIDLFTGDARIYKSIKEAIQENLTTSIGHVLNGKHLFTNKKKYTWILGEQYSTINMPTYLEDIKIKSLLSVCEGKNRKRVLNTATGIFYLSIKEAYESTKFKCNIDYFTRQLCGKMNNETDFILA